MEEWVGGFWHRFITRKSSAGFAGARVEFESIRKSIGIVFRALGGDAIKRVEPASTQDYLARRSILQKISGANQRVSLAWQDEDSLRLPESLALFPEISLNRDLYYWLAILAAHHNGKFSHWAQDNQNLVLSVLEKYPALQARYNRLAVAFVASRAVTSKLPEEEQLLENAIVEAILKPGSVKSFPAVNYAPQAVYLWLYPASHAEPMLAPEQDEEALLEDEEQAEESASKESKTSRKKAERKDVSDSKGGMMIFRLESLFSWSEFSKLDRGSDDSDEDDDQSVAEDLDIITLAQQQDQKSARIKIDLDLPSAAEDDIRLGEGITLPEWDYRKQQLVKDRCLLQPMLPKNAIAQALPRRLQKQAKLIQAQFEQLSSSRHWLKAQPQGEELDLNAWLDHHIESRIAPMPEKGLYQSYRGKHRDLSCLLLADLSMSTDAYIDNNSRVIDVIRDSMLLFGEALQAVGDNFAMYGFSSVKRSHVRFTMIKNFNEPYSDEVRGRIQAVHPGFYTRMGAAIRQASKICLEQKTTQRLMLIITDGKPNDTDQYEGRFGIEDTRQAILEARRSGIKPFCITVDQKAEDYLPYIFGSDAFSVITRPTQLPISLPHLYYQLTHT